MTEVAEKYLTPNRIKYPAHSCMWDGALWPGKHSTNRLKDCVANTPVSDAYD